MADSPPEPDLRRLRMRAEVGAESPLWTDRGVMVWLDQLPIGAELRRALAAWADAVWANMRPSAEWQAEGRALHEQLLEELGPDYQVVFDDSDFPTTGA